MSDNNISNRQREISATEQPSAIEQEESTAPVASQVNPQQQMERVHRLKKNRRL